MNSFLKGWINVSAAVSVGGWILSAVHQLNALGYLVYFALVTCFFVAVFRPALPEAQPHFWKNRNSFWRRFFRRFRRPFPFAFLVLAILALIGGALYSPNNFDAMTYRTPRVLHWLAHEQWHWIHTPDPRMNTRAGGFEWLTAPLLVFMRSDRPFFVVNGISFLLLPGLIYSVFIRLGVRRRVAWHWMWLLPAGFNFILQAGSIANDLFGAVYVLAAIGFAMRARRSKQLSDIWYSLVAAGLLTGAKASNLPLLIPWFVALGPSLRLLRIAPVRSIMIMAVAGAASYLPSAMLNARHCKDWSGAILENPRYQIHDVGVGIIGNAIDLAFENLSLPVSSLPLLNGEKLSRWVPDKFREAYNQNFATPFGSTHGGNGIQTEDGAGIGLGLSFLIVASYVAACFCAIFRSKRRMDHKLSVARCDIWFRRALVFSFIMALLVFMSKAGMNQAGRLISPYYPLLFAALLLLREHEVLVRQRWWKAAAWIVFLMAGTVLILSPARPLLPVQALFRQLDQWKVKNSFLERAKASYVGNAHRSDGLASLRALIPADIHVVACVSQGNDIETSLWKPFGRRRVEYMFATDNAEDMKHRGVEYVVISGDTLKNRGQTFDEWLLLNHAEKVGQQTFLRVFPPYVSYDWFVARISL